MRYILKNTLLSSKPELSVTFVDNHDTQYGQALESFVLEWFKPHAYSIILLRNEGYPCVFYGDYYGIPNNNLSPVKELKTLIKLRECSAYGKLHDYFNDSKIVGWTLEGEDEHTNSGLAILMTVEKGGNKKMYVGKHFAGLIFIDSLKNVTKEIVIDEEGFGEFFVNDGSVSVYRLKLGQTVGERDNEYYVDENEVSAYAEIDDGVEPELVYGSNYNYEYKHMEE
jgi:alpha-amylase